MAVLNNQLEPGDRVARGPGNPGLGGPLKNGDEGTIFEVRRNSRGITGVSIEWDKQIHGFSHDPWNGNGTHCAERWDATHFECGNLIILPPETDEWADELEFGEPDA